MNMKKRQARNSPAAQSRDEATRTPDPYVPNVVRYQLRYIPICVCKGKKKKNETQAFFEEIYLKICPVHENMLSLHPLSNTKASK